MAEAVPDSGSVKKECWTEDNLKEALRRITAGEISVLEVENLYGIPLRTVYRERAKENIKAQLNTCKPTKPDMSSSSTSKRVDYSILNQPVGIGCCDLNSAIKMLSTGTDEVKHILKNECVIIYECKACRALFRSVVNFISHKRLHCELCVPSFQGDSDNDEQQGADNKSLENELSTRQYVREQINRPQRVTCRADLTTILNKIMHLPPLFPEPILKLQRIDSNSSAVYQTLITNTQVFNQVSETHQFTARQGIINDGDSNKPKPIVNKANSFSKPKNNSKPGGFLPTTTDKPKNTELPSKMIPMALYRCPCCTKCMKIRSSIIRHLQKGHRKTKDQVIKLKCKIKRQIIRTSSSKSFSSGTSEETTLNSSPKKPKEYLCKFCQKNFSYSRSLQLHVKHRCSIRKRLENLKSNKLLASPLSNVKNGQSIPVVNASSSSCESQSKKIGIQVRMNYCKNSKNTNTNNVVSSNSTNDDNLSISTNNSNINCTKNIIKGNDNAKSLPSNINETLNVDEKHFNGFEQNVAGDSKVDVINNLEKTGNENCFPRKNITTCAMSMRSRSSKIDLQNLPALRNRSSIKPENWSDKSNNGTKNKSSIPSPDKSNSQISNKIVPMENSLIIQGKSANNNLEANSMAVKNNKSPPNNQKKSLPPAESNSGAHIKQRKSSIVMENSENISKNNQNSSNGIPLQNFRTNSSETMRNRSSSILIQNKLELEERNLNKKSKIVLNNKNKKLAEISSKIVKKRPLKMCSPKINNNDGKPKVNGERNCKKKLLKPDTVVNMRNKNVRKMSKKSDKNNGCKLTTPSVVNSISSSNKKNVKKFKKSENNVEEAISGFKKAVGLSIMKSDKNPPKTYGRAINTGLKQINHVHFESVKNEIQEQMIVSSSLKGSLRSCSSQNKIGNSSQNNNNNITLNVQNPIIVNGDINEIINMDIDIRNDDDQASIDLPVNYSEL